MTVDKSNARVRKMFGEIAPRYDFLNHLLSLNVDRYWRWRTVRKVAPNGGDRILDVCTGTGDLALAYFNRSSGGARVVAADFCHEMLAIGAEKSRRAGANGEVKWIEADTQDLPFPDNSFEIVSVAFGLRNVADTDGGLREMTRVCAPGGRVAVLEFSMPERQPVKGIYRAYFRYILPRVGQLLTRNQAGAYNYLPESVGEFPQGSALCEKMTNAGLRDVRWYPLTFGIASLYVGRKPCE